MTTIAAASTLTPDKGNLTTEKVTVTDTIARGRAWVKSVGRDAAIAALKGATVSVPTPLQVTLTRWSVTEKNANGEAKSPYHGEPGKPGQGIPWTGTLEAHNEIISFFANSVFEKKMGRPYSPTITNWHGHSNLDVAAKTALILDGDDQGEWDSILSAVESIGCCASWHRSGGHKPGHPKFHVELWLSAPVVAPPPPAGVRYESPEWKSWALAHRAWVDGVWKPGAAYLTGVLAELGDVCFDPAIPSHVGGLLYPPHRRTEDATAQVGNDFRDTGRALDWDLALAATGFQAPVRASVPGVVAPVDPDAVARQEAFGDRLEAAFKAWGKHLGEKRGRVLVECPWDHEHSGGVAGDSSTVLMDGGRFVCSHGHCSGRHTKDVLAVMPPSIRAIAGSPNAAPVMEIFDGLEGVDAASLWPSNPNFPLAEDRGSNGAKCPESVEKNGAPLTQYTDNSQVVPWSVTRWDAPTIESLGLTYLPITPPAARVTYVRAPQGVGKTEMASGWVKSITGTAGHLPVLSVCHRRSLGRQQSSRLGIPNYETITGPISGDAVVCLDSIRRVRTEALDGNPGELRQQRFSLVILDEVSQLIRHIFSGTMDGWESVRAWTALKSVLGAADRVLAMDADLDAWTIKRIRELMGLSPEDGTGQELRWWDAPPPCTYRVDTDTAVTDDSLFTDWEDGKRLAIYVQSRRGSEGKALQMRDDKPVAWMRDQLTARRPDSKVLVVNSDRVHDPDVVALLSDPSTASRWDAIIYTSTLGTGFSIDVRGHFHQVYVYSSDGVGCVQDLRQGAHRVRHPANTEIRIACPDRGNPPKDGNPERIYEVLTALGDATIRAVDPQDGPRTVSEYVVGDITYTDGVRHVEPHKTPHTRLYCEVLGYERRNGGQGGSRHAALVAYLQSTGAKVTVTGAMSKDLRAPIVKASREARKAVRAIREARVLAARDLTDEDFDAMREPASQGDSDAKEKHSILDFYGKATPDIIHRDDEGAYRAKCRAIARLRAFRQDPEKVRDMDRRELGAKRPLSHSGLHYTRAALVDRLLRLVGLPEDIAAWDGVQVTPEMAAKAILAAVKGARLLAELGITVRRDVAKNPVQLVGSILGKLGVRLTEKKSHGQRTYVVGDTTQVRADSARYLARVMDPEWHPRKPRKVDLDAMVALLDQA